MSTPLNFKTHQRRGGYPRFGSFYAVAILDCPTRSASEDRLEDTHGAVLNAMRWFILALLASCGCAAMRPQPGARTLLAPPSRLIR